MLRPRHYEDVELQLRSIFYEILFRPLVDLMAQSGGLGTLKLENAAGDELEKALRTGAVQYVEGEFTGKFSAAISRDLRALGASLDKRSGTYKLSAAEVPNWVRTEASVQLARARDAHGALKKLLDKTETELDARVKARPVDASKVVAGVEKGWQTTAQKLELRPDLSPASRAQLSADYSDNMELWIKKFSKESIAELREAVEENAVEGYRMDALIQRIEQRYEVSRNKAKFLARQETALFMSKFRRERFSEAGVRMYRWSTSHDERVRSSHKHLDGKVFSYDNPPIVDLATGRKANPGEDFGCRCVDIPVLRAVAMEAA